MEDKRPDNRTGGPETGPGPGGKPGSRLWIILLFIILALAAGLYLMLGQSGKKDNRDVVSADSLLADSEGRRLEERQAAGQVTGTEQNAPSDKQVQPGHNQPLSKTGQTQTGRKPTDLRTDRTDAERKVSIYKPEITKLYLHYNPIKQMKGTLRFDLGIDASGKVTSVQVTPQSGKFYPEFLQKVKEQVGKWEFDNTNALEYSFFMTFSG